MSSAECSMGLRSFLIHHNNSNNNNNNSNNNNTNNSNNVKNYSNVTDDNIYRIKNLNDQQQLKIKFFSANGCYQSPLNVNNINDKYCQKVLVNSNEFINKNDFNNNIKSDAANNIVDNITVSSKILNSYNTEIENMKKANNGQQKNFNQEINILSNIQTEKFIDCNSLDNDSQKSILIKQNSKLRSFNYYIKSQVIFF